MSKQILFLILLLTTKLFAVDNRTILALTNIIEREEEIAKSYEKYLLNEFKIPTMHDLLEENADSKIYYLGENFSIKNMFGRDLSFVDNKNARLNIALDEKKYKDEYIKLYYKRDLYRDFTSVYEDNSGLKYVQIVLKSIEAQNIFNILSSGNEILKVDKDEKCQRDKYCVIPNENIKTIRRYTKTDSYIAYNLKDMDKGSVYISKKIINPPLKTDDNIYLEMGFDKLNIGTIIYSDGKRYIKLNTGIYGVE